MCGKELTVRGKAPCWVCNEDGQMLNCRKQVGGEASLPTPQYVLTGRYRSVNTSPGGIAPFVALRLSERL